MTIRTTRQGRILVLHPIFFALFRCREQMFKILVLSEHLLENILRAGRASGAYQDWLSIGDIYQCERFSIFMEAFYPVLWAPGGTR